MLMPEIAVLTIIDPANCGLITQCVPGAHMGLKNAQKWIRFVAHFLGQRLNAFAGFGRNRGLIAQGQRHRHFVNAGGFGDGIEGDGGKFQLTSIVF